MPYYRGRLCAGSHLPLQTKKKPGRYLNLSGFALSVPASAGIQGSRSEDLCHFTRKLFLFLDQSSKLLVIEEVDGEAGAFMSGDVRLVSQSAAESVHVEVDDFRRRTGRGDESAGRAVPLA